MAAPNGGQADGTDVRPLAILAIDDNPTDTLLIEEQIRTSLGAHYEMVGVGSLAEGCDALRHKHFDVVLLDLDLPDSVNRDIEALHAIVPGLPLIVCTGKSDEARLLELLGRGASDCLLKSEADGRQLLRVIRFSLARSGERRPDDAQAPPRNAREADLRAIIEAGWDAKLVVGDDGHILFANQATEELFGRSLAQLRTFPFGVPQVRQDVSEVDVLRPDGTLRNVEMRVVRITWHGTRANHITLHDVTERHQREAELRQALAEKEAMATALAESNAALEQYASVVAHDLQAPVRGIGQFLQLLQADYGELLSNAGADELLGHIGGSAQHMQEVIGDLLKLARVDGDDSVAEPVDCNALVDEVFGELGEVDSRDLQVTRGDLPSVCGHSVQLRLLFQNLIGNGLKFQPGPSPRVHVSAEVDGDGWCFSVCDWGIGIRPEDKGRIFGLFRRLNDNSIYPGTGIGLTICERVVRAHGGRLWVESKPGAGSTFHFTLPGPAAG